MRGCFHTTNASWKDVNRLDEAWKLTFAWWIFFRNCSGKAFSAKGLYDKIVSLSIRCWIQKRLHSNLYLNIKSNITKKPIFNMLEEHVLLQRQKRFGFEAGEIFFSTIFATPLYRTIERRPLLSYTVLCIFQMDFSWFCTYTLSNDQKNKNCWTVYIILQKLTVSHQFEPCEEIYLLKNSYISKITSFYFCCLSLNIMSFISGIKVFGWMQLTEWSLKDRRLTRFLACQ